MTDVVEGNLYDYPVYYDLIFGSDWRAEFDFLTACFDRFAGRPVRRIFEPACGTGRLLDRMAQAGYEVSGNDLNANAVEFCNKRLRKKGFPETADAAFNPINTFRHLGTEKQAHSHLQCMADALAKGGLYILGLHLIPTDGDRLEEEAWHARRGNLAVNTYMWSKGIDEKTRMEYLGLKINVFTPTKQMVIEDEMLYRTYSARQMKSLLKKVPAFECVGIYDFAYDLDQPVTIGPDTEDVVYVLKKK